MCFMNFRTPLELAKAACVSAKIKSTLTIREMMVLGTLAGAYISFGGYLNIVVTQDMAQHMGVGFTKLIGGAVFSIGLMIVVVAGAELFTGNCMMPLGTLAGCAPWKGVLRNWFWVYIANLLGTLIVAFLVYESGLWRGAVGVNALRIAATKMSIPFWEAFVRGILCNWIVVLAVWMSMAALDVTGKLFSAFFLIMTFVACGFEHSIANMFFLEIGLLVSGNNAVTEAAKIDPALMNNVTIGGYFGNIIPVTLGNIVGGMFFVACLYFLAYRPNLGKIE
jgi:formate/nitrite transporter